MNDDDLGWLDWPLIIWAAILGTVILAVVELIRLPGRFWRAIR